jgi:hypothetical protein
MKDSLYHLCGDLVLEDPSLFLDGPKRTRLAELMPHFRQLDQKQGTGDLNLLHLPTSIRTNTKV